MAEEHIPVGVSYRVHDEGASQAADHIGKSLDHAAHSSHGLRHKLGELRQELGLTAPALLGVGFGLGMWVEKAKEANVEFGRTKRAVASTLSTMLNWDAGTSAIERYRRSSVLAAEVTEKLQDVHARFGSSLEELGNAYRTVAISGGPLKLSQKQILDLTTEAAAAAKLFGVSGEDAAARIGNALMGRIRPGGDAFNRQLNTMLGNVKKLGGAKIFEGMGKQLEKLVPLADEASQGIGDNVRRIQHQVELLFEHASAPLFKEIASSLGLAAKEAERFGASGRPLVEEYADKLVEAFRELKTITGFLFDHWKQIAGVWAGMKAINLGTSIAGAMAGGGGAGGKGGKIGGFIKGTGVPILSALAGVAAEELYSGYREGKTRIKTAETLRGAFTGMREVNENPADAASSFGKISTTFEKAGIRSKDQALAMLESVTESVGLPGQTKTSELLGMSLDELKHLRQDLIDAVKVGTFHFKGEEDENADAKKRVTGKAPINIANATFKFDFENTDPDRVFIRVADELERFHSRRTQSAITPPGVE